MSQVNITKLEAELLRKMALDQYNPTNGAEPTTYKDVNTWADVIITSKKKQGAFTSLQTKGLVWHNGEGCGFTQAGFDAYKALTGKVEAEVVETEQPAVAEETQEAPANHGVRIIDPQMEVTHMLDMTPSQEAAAERYILATLKHFQEDCDYKVRLADLTIKVCEERSTGKALTIAVDLTMVHERAIMWTTQSALIGPKGGIDGFRQDRRKGRTRLAPIDKMEDLWGEVLISHGSY